MGAGIKGRMTPAKWQISIPDHKLVGLVEGTQRPIQKFFDVRALPRGDFWHYCEKGRLVDLTHSKLASTIELGFATAT